MRRDGRTLPDAMSLDWSDLVHVATKAIESKDWLGLSECCHICLWSDLVHVATKAIESKDWLGLTECLHLWSDLVHVATTIIQSKDWLGLTECCPIMVGPGACGYQGH